MRASRARRPGIHSTGSYSGALATSLTSFAAVGGMTLFTSILSARLYGIRVVGQAALVMAPIAVVTLLSTVREQPSMVRELAKRSPRHPEVTGIVLAVFTFSFALTAVVSLLGMIACYFAFRGPLHQPTLVAPAIVALAGYLVIVNTGWNIDGVFAAFRASRELFAVRLHQAVIYALLLVGFAQITHSVWGMLWAFLGSWASALAHRLALLPRALLLRVPLTQIRRGFALLPVIVSFGARMTPGFLAAGFSEASGTWILGATGSIVAVGAYSRAWSFASRLGEVNWRITEMLLPTLVRHQHAGDHEAAGRVLRESLRYAAFGMLLPAAVGAGAADTVMHVFGSGFQAAAQALRFLLLVPVLQTLVAIQGAALVAHGRPLLESMGQIVRLVVTLGGGVALAHSQGITGLALAMAGGALASFCVLAVAMWRLGIPVLGIPRAREMAGFIGAYAAGFTVAYLITRELGGALGLLLALLAGSVSYLTVGLLVAGTTVRDRERVRRLARWIGGSARVLGVPDTA